MVEMSVSKNSPVMYSARLETAVSECATGSKMLPLFPKHKLFCNITSELHQLINNLQQFSQFYMNCVFSFLFQIGLQHHPNTNLVLHHKTGIFLYLSCYLG